MVRPNLTTKKPCFRMYDIYTRERPSMPQQDVQRPDRPDTPSPTLSSSLRYLTIRRNRVHKISRGLIHIHKNSSRTRKPTCPANATCVGIDDIGEYMYNQAKKCKYFMEEVNRMRESNVPSTTGETPNGDFVAGEPIKGKFNVVVEFSPAQSGMQPRNCWDQQDSSESP